MPYCADRQCFDAPQIISGHLNLRIRKAKVFTKTTSVLYPTLGIILLSMNIDCSLGQFY
uniref:Uncharacterized protein n=1 Tax=Moniliophthora roreri TaxID=221103 RepID=A0A0W0EZU5_MONRR